MTTNFYAPPSAIQNRRVVLPEEEARHVRSVLRGREGDEIVVVDGEGGWYRVEITHMAPNQVVGRVLDERRDVHEPDVHVTVALGVLKKRSRLETFVEKAVELGVGRIAPLITTRTERDTIREDRLRNIMVAALKQCRRSRLPTLEPVQSVDHLLSEEPWDRALLCHGQDTAPPLVSALDGLPSHDRLLLLVGPEGGFSNDEVAEARASGCSVVSLGPRRLRAETAALAALTGVMLCRT